MNAASRPARPAWIAGALAVALAAAVATALAAPAPSRPAAASPDRVAAGKRAFVDVARVLQSPRCRNCHPAGDAPLQTDAGVPHAMNVTRRSAESGLPCSTCHQERNAEAVGVPGGPPGAPKWDLPPRATPMVFEGRAPSALCEQLKDPAQNGARSLAALVEHVSSDPLVLWGWRPGGRRTRPPLSHARFVAAFRAWVDAGASCP
jgi:cytochrome c peroxidase